LPYKYQGEAMRNILRLMITAVLLPVFVTGVLRAGGAPMKLSSPSFKSGESIPRQFTCEGESINPPLAIENIPPGTKSLALIVEDPDAAGTFIHWVAYDIMVTERIDENSTAGIAGLNSAGKTGYTGPCPPAGPAHRYFFRLYALDTMLHMPGGLSKSRLEKAMKTHILAETELMGRYRKQSPVPAGR
jgi:Raf kinase inhibitor-like YbhB/YbcL family protein